MRVILSVLFLAALASAQSTPATKPDAGAVTPASATTGGELTIPAGTKFPVELKHAVSSKGTHEGDGVYAETTFPVVINGRVMIPAGTYVQGRISHIQRGGRVKGRAEVQMHFTTLIYPSGYTVLLPGAVENAPGVDKTSVNGEEGTIRADSQTGQKAGTVATTAGAGAVAGGLSNGGKGASGRRGSWWCGRHCDRVINSRERCKDGCRHDYGDRHPARCSARCQPRACNHAGVFVDAAVKDQPSVPPRVIPVNNSQSFSFFARSS